MYILITNMEVVEELGWSAVVELTGNPLIFHISCRHIEGWFTVVNAAVGKGIPSSDIWRVSADRLLTQGRPPYERSSVESCRQDWENGLS